MTWALAITLIFLTLLGIALTLVGLPGIWLMIAVAIIVELVEPTILEWWVIAVCLALAVGAEIAEASAGAVGARSRGASKRAMAASILGAILGAIAGTILLPFLPVIGTILGSALGAGLFAVGVELYLLGQKRRLGPDANTPAGSEPLADAVDTVTSKLDQRSDLRRLIEIGLATATGRLLAVIIKGAFAVAVAAALTADALFHDTPAPPVP